MRAQGSKSHYNEMNVFSVHALIGAYKPEEYEWVDELCQVLSENIDYACEHILKNYKGVKFFKPQGTYKTGTDVGVMWQDGRPFNRPYAICLNLALPKSKVIEAFERLDKYVFRI